MNAEKQTSKTNNRSILGIVLIAAGGLFLLDYFTFFSKDVRDVLFSWPMLLIGIGTLNILVKGNMRTGLILLSIGGFFMLRKITGIDIDNKILVPVLLVPF